MAQNTTLQKTDFDRDITITEHSEQVKDIYFQDMNLIHNKINLINILGKITISASINESFLIINHPCGFDIHIGNAIYEKSIHVKEEYQKEKKEINDTIKDISGHIVLRKEIKYYINVFVDNIDHENSFRLDNQTYHLIPVIIILLDEDNSYNINKKTYLLKAGVVINNTIKFQIYKHKIISDYSYELKFNYDNQMILPSETPDFITLQKIRTKIRTQMKH